MVHRPRTPQAQGVRPALPHPSWTRAAPLSAHDLAWRHRLVAALVLTHAPVLLGLALLADQAVWLAALQVAPVLLAWAVAIGPFRQRTRTLAASAGLLWCSALLMHLFAGQPAAQVHIFVAVAVIALYQDGSALALVAAWVLVQPLAERSVRGWALATGAAVLAECAVLVVFWRAEEHARRGEQRLQAALWEGHDSVRARLEETERIRTDLIGTVSHEFRTPLTGIRGAALTLLKRGDRLDECGRELLLRGVLDQQERLSRLLENMLTAARATSADPAAVADVHAVATEVAMLASSERPDSPPVSVVIEPGVVARIDRHALHQVLANLVDNAQQHGVPGAVPLIAGGQDAGRVWMAVSNEGGPLDLAAVNRLFEPFTQADAGSTRAHEGLGMGLYVVRRLLDVYAGKIAVRSDGGWVTVEVHLRSADLPVRQRVAVA